MSTPPVRAPDITELRTFCTAADLGSLGRAAVRLRVSQPALTKRLQALEALAGVRLLDRSSRGVALTPAGRRLYEQARRLLEQSDAVVEVIAGLRGSSEAVMLASSHSATEAFVADVLLRLYEEDAAPVELVTANSMVVRRLVADGRAEVGVAAGRPSGTPNPGVREVHLADDEIVYAVPRGHRWANRTRVTLEEFLRTPVVTRDPASNARWTVEAVLRRRNLALPPLLVQTSTPSAARREALSRNAPLLLSRRVLRDDPFVVLEIKGLAFPRRWDLVLPAIGDPRREVLALVERLNAAAAGTPVPGR